MVTALSALPKDDNSVDFRQAEATSVPITLILLLVVFGAIVAAGTSGRSIVVSGLTVMIAMAGLFLTGIDQFTGIALGTIAVVGIAVAGSLTVLPALLSWLGQAGRLGPDPVPRPQPCRGPPVPAMGGAGAPRGGPPGDLGRHRRGGPARAGRARARHAAGAARPSTCRPARSCARRAPAAPNAARLSMIMKDLILAAVSNPS